LARQNADEGIRPPGRWRNGGIGPDGDEISNELFNTSERFPRLKWLPFSGDHHKKVGDSLRGKPEFTDEGQWIYLDEIESINTF
jgi:hypothetical protein